ncbi:MAG TPA: serpin family protein [Anaerolineaceae bacterium]|nr:serpin family protein [Anaerolineaceae bacterium]
MIFDEIFTEEMTESEMNSLVANNTSFALALYRQLQAAEGNLFFSPYSISSALAMTYAGAKEATRAQMAQALRFNEDDKLLHAGFKQLREALEKSGKESGNRLMVANSLWPQANYRLRRVFLNLVKRYYGVKISRVDYGDAESARQKINAWVEEKTEQKISDLISPGVLDSLTRLVLVNAIYFKGAWEHPFAADQTHEGSFHPTGGEAIQLQMMHQKNSFRYTEDENVQVLELPYTGSDLSMLVVLPKAKDGLGQLEASLTTENLQIWENFLAETEVNVTLPRFELAFPFRLDDALQNMGMTDAFTGAADFSGMEQTRELYLGAVLHKAFIAVNEEGTEAAAATAVIMQTKSISFMSVDFVADHPFVFLIRDNRTGTLLFLGRMVKPQV